MEKDENACHHTTAGSAKRGRLNNDAEFTVFRDLGLPSLKGELVFVELCAGSGILSATAEEYGFFPFPVDHDHPQPRITRKRISNYQPKGFKHCSDGWETQFVA